MKKQARYKGVYAIGDTDPANLPVCDLDAALPYYAHLGFIVEARKEDQGSLASLSLVPSARHWSLEK